MPDTLTDELAEALTTVITALVGYSNCPTVQALAEDAMPVLAKYTQAKAAQDVCQSWLAAHYPDVWQEWQRASLIKLRIWLQVAHPPLWDEYYGTEP